MFKNDKLDDIFWSVVLGGVATAGLYPFSSILAEKITTTAANKEKAFIALEVAAMALSTAIIYKITGNVKSNYNVNYVDYDKDMEYVDSEEVIKCCDTCSNGCCRVPTSEKIGVNEYGEPEGSRCIGYLPPKTKIKK